MPGTLDSLRPRAIAWQRLASQRLVGPPFAAPLDVVRQLGAVQAQDYSASKWGIAQRTPGATDREVERALTDGAIVRTHVLRPTWHWVAAEDIRWMLALTAPRVRALMTYYDRKLELDDGVFARSAAVLTKALAGGMHLTRAELGTILARARIGATSGQRLAHLMMRAELDALVCSGARRGKQFTYALLDERVPAARARPREEALAELATRYFRTRGPATVYDFAWWSGLTVSDAGRGIESIVSSLERRTADGRTYWMAGDAPPAVAAPGVAHLLPNYDEYFIGLKDRSAISETIAASRVAVTADAFAGHVIIVNGQLVGGWKRIATGRTLRLALRFVVGVTARQRRAVEAQAQRLGAFLALPGVVDIER